MRRIQRWIFKAVRWQNCKFKRKKGSTQYCDDFLLLTMNLSYHLSTSTGLPWAFLYSISNLMGTSWRFLLLASRHICVVVFFPADTSPLQARWGFPTHTRQDMCGHRFSFFFFLLFCLRTHTPVPAVVMEITPVYNICFWYKDSGDHAIALVFLVFTLS